MHYDLQVGCQTTKSQPLEILQLLAVFNFGLQKILYHEVYNTACDLAFWREVGYT